MDRTRTSFDVRTGIRLLDDGRCQCGSHRFDPVEIFAQNGDMIVRCKRCGTVLAIPPELPLTPFSHDGVGQRGAQQNEAARL